MSTTWGDVQAEMAADFEWERLQRELESRELKSVALAVRDGFEDSKDVIFSLTSEIQNLDVRENTHSFAMLHCTLMEVIEREVIGLPFMIAGLGVHEIDRDHADEIKKMISKGFSSAKFVCAHFEKTTKDFPKIKLSLDEALKNFVPGHKKFVPETDLTQYREKITSLRNYLMHGRGITTESEAKYLGSFANKWRAEVCNSLLKKYELALDENWSLIDSKPPPAQDEDMNF
jgi:hypothetical protein